MDFKFFGDFTSLRFVKLFKIQERTAVAGWSPVGVTGVLAANDRHFYIVKSPFKGPQI